MFGDELLKATLTEALSASAAQLLEFRIRMMEEEVSQGWRCFHARASWFSKHLPAPLINKLGYAYTIGELQCRLKALAEGTKPRLSTTRAAMITSPAMRAEYRNYLDAGTLEVETFVGEPFARDLTADEVTRRLLHAEGRHFRYEIDRDEETNWREALSRSTETPPPVFVQAAPVMPVRNSARPLHKDASYWRAVYALPQRRVHDYAGTLAPDCTHQLMARLAPDFPHDPAASTKRQIVFSRAAGPSLRWCLTVGYERRSKFPAYPPKLLLAAGSSRLRSVFNDVLDDGLGQINDSSPRGVETQLRYWIPRFRKLIDFYAERFSL